MKYKILEQIGEGSYGKVYKATTLAAAASATADDNVQSTVAIKVITLLDQDGSLPLSCYREIRMLKSCLPLENEGIIALLDVFILEEKVHLVFEYCPYDLSSLFIEQHRRSLQMPPLVILGIVKELLSALAMLGGKGVVHRDIKASNILISPSGTVKLADFGLTKGGFNDFSNSNDFNSSNKNNNANANNISINRRILHTNRVVTLGYRSPELLFGTTTYGQEVDAWAVGCLILQFLGDGTLPFKGVDEWEQIESMQSYYSPYDWSLLSDLPWFSSTSFSVEKDNNSLTTKTQSQKNLFKQTNCPIETVLQRISKGMLMIDKTKRMTISEGLSIIEEFLSSSSSSSSKTTPTKQITIDFIRKIIPKDMHEWKSKGLEN